MLQEIVQVFLFGLVAFLYATVGHGGASAYLALMGLYEVAPEHLRPTALLLNLLVASIALRGFMRAGYYPFRKFLWLFLSAVPAAYAGASVDLGVAGYRMLLGLVLLLPSLHFLVRVQHDEPAGIKVPAAPAMIGAGLSIGLLSGLLGVGGGILLSPLLLLKKWAGVRETAALSALLILLNSLAGLLALGIDGFRPVEAIGWIIPSVLIGALAGTYSGARGWNTPALKRMLGLVLLIAALKLILSA